MSLSCITAHSELNEDLGTKMPYASKTRVPIFESAPFLTNCVQMELSRYRCIPQQLGQRMARAQHVKCTDRAL